MDSSFVRLVSQIALTTWSLTEIVMLLLTRGRLEEVTGTRWAIIGLGFFAAWMLLSSISISATALIPRGHLIWLFASLEAGTAVGAWGWLIVNMRTKFKITSGMG